MKKKQVITAHLLAIITILLWGNTFISTKILLRTLTPSEILVIRFLLGFVVLFAIRPKFMKLKKKSHELLFAGAGLCGVTLYLMLENYALSYTYAANTSVIVSISPFFTAFLMQLFLKTEKLRLWFFISFIIALTGIFLISFSSQKEFGLNPFGDFLALLAAVSWGFYSIITKKISQYGYQSIETTRRIFFYGLIFMIPVIILEGGVRTELFPLLLKTENVINLFYLGFMASALCYVVWNYCIKVLGAVKTSVYIYLIPVTAVIGSFIILKEEITLLGLVGIALTLIGLFLSEKGTKNNS